MRINLLESCKVAKEQIVCHEKESRTVGQKAGAAIRPLLLFYRRRRFTAIRLLSSTTRVVKHLLQRKQKHLLQRNSVE
jgi:hypothetical protein